MIQIGFHVWCPPIKGERAYYHDGEWVSQAVVTKIMGNGNTAHLLSLPSLRITRAPVASLKRTILKVSGGPMFNWLEKYFEGEPAVEQKPAEGGWFTGGGTWSDSVKVEAESAINRALATVHQESPQAIYAA